MDIRKVAAKTLPFVLSDFSMSEKASNQQTFKRVKDLCNLIENRFAGDSYAEQTFSRAYEEPSSEDRRCALRGILVDEMRADAEFARAVHRRLKQIQVASNTPISQSIIITGKAQDVIQIGKISGNMTNIEGDGNIAGDENQSSVHKS